jgi:hypothetical protein
MARPFLIGIGILAVLAITPFANGQTPAKPYTPAKTPWGDPDLEGIWPGNMGVPMQRPKNLGERTTLTDEEYAQRLAQAEQLAAADNEERAPKDARVGIGPPSYWTERGKPTRQASMIIDPPDGRIPPLTPEAQRRRKEARGGLGDPAEWAGKADSWEDLKSVLPLHHTRRDWLDRSRRVQQWQSDSASAGIRRDPERDDPRISRDSFRWPPPHRTNDQGVHGRFARPLGGEHSGHRNHQFHGQDQHWF